MLGLYAMMLSIYLSVCHFKHVHKNVAFTKKYFKKLELWCPHCIDDQ